MTSSSCHMALRKNDSCPPAKSSSLCSGWLDIGAIRTSVVSTRNNNMGKSNSKTRSRRKTRDALKILDKHFGTYPGEEDLDAQFDEQIDVAQALYDARTAARLTQSQLAK